MFSKSQNWLRHNLRTARIKNAAILSFVVLVVLFGVVQANGPMRPQPPHRPGMGQRHGSNGPNGPNGSRNGYVGKDEAVLVPCCSSSHD